MRDESRSTAAAALRRMGHAFVAHEADEALLARVAEAADQLTTQLDNSPPLDRDFVDLKRRMFQEDGRDGARISHFDECFVSGLHNPMGIAIDVRRVEDESVAKVTLGAAFEGAPGRAHGGIVAAIFDDVLGYLLTFIKQPAFTGELTVRYLAPTPIGKTIEFRGRIIDQDDTKFFAEADAVADDIKIGTAKGVFVKVNPNRFRRQ